MDARTGDFKNSAADLSRSGASQTFKFERQDWALFRTAEGLSQKAGVPKHKLPRLVMKELADNGLDEGGQVRVGKLPDEAGYFVEDSGRGIDPAEVPRLFCISRPLVSTKLLRLPTRGALGNGLRVVAGAVLASTGTLCVITRNRRIELRPEYDGTTTVVRTTEVDFPTGARVEINFGPALPASDPTPVLAWAEFACAMAEGKVYAGRSSPHWYDGPQFFELINAAGERPVREVIAELDGCTGATAGKIVETAKLNRAVCKDINQEQATVLLEAARVFAKPVTAKRLGAVGGDLLPQRAYAVAYGFVEFGTEKPLAQIPFVVECWAEKVRTDTRLMMCVNRTPITGVVDIDRNKREINAFGCGLRHTIAQAPVEAQFSLLVNLITPFVPITSDGKEPDLEPFLDEIETAVGKAVRKAHRPTAKGRVSIKDVVFNHLEDIIADVSKNGTFEFNPRHLLYPLRPVVQNEIGKELSTENFNSILTDYENEFGEIPGMYREPRGSIRHPHTREKIELSTRSVEEYERPPWLYNKVISIEKEGFDGTFAKTHFQERYDCTITSSKGFGTRAARDFVDMLAEHDEPVTVFLVHDADAHGTRIYHAFVQATRARGARKIKVINLGLEPWEAIAMGLDVEPVPVEKRRKPVGDYIRERKERAPDGTSWDDWLQTHRIEINALKPERFIAWLDSKLAGYEKLIPPEDVLEEDVRARIERKIRAAEIERILRENNAEAQIAAAITAIKPPDGTTLTTGVKDLFKAKPAAHWRDHTEAVATELAAGGRPHD